MTYRRRFTALTPFLLVAVLATVPVAAEFIAGVETDGQPPQPNGSADTDAAPAGSTTIDFDEISQPCSFDLTVAVREEYAAMGVHFSAPGNDGGAILDECSNFGVTGQPSPNFLAFNSQAQFSDGAIPRTPETITFDFPISLFQINAGAGGGQGNVTIDAYDAGDQLVDSDTIASMDALQTMIVTGAGITRIEVNNTGVWLVLDDMAFIDGVPVPAMPSWVVGVLILALVGAAILALRVALGS